MSRLCLLAAMISLISSSIAHASVTSSKDGGRFLRGDWEMPEWFQRLENEDETGLMRSCWRKAPKPPEDGKRCGRQEKLCFFGNQDCDGVGAHPKRKCYCDGEDKTQRWSCGDVACPSVESPETTMDIPTAKTTTETPKEKATTVSSQEKTTTQITKETTTTATTEVTTTTEEVNTMFVEAATTNSVEGTTTNASTEGTTTIDETKTSDMVQETTTQNLDGASTFDVAETTTVMVPLKPATTVESIASKAPLDPSNIAICPEKSPLDAGMGPCLKEEDGLACSYGSETCCGKENANHMCQCDANFGWGCFFTDACMVPQCQYTDWSDLKGKTCDEAINAISLKYPGMTVLCQTKSDPNPTDDDHNRYVVYTDDNGVVTSVVFNRYAECPATKSPFLFCTMPSQECLYTEDASTDSTSCTTTTTCTCSSSSGMFECVDSVVCEPESTVLSPDELPSSPGGFPVPLGTVPFIPDDQHETVTISAPFKGYDYTPFPSAAPSTSS